MVKMAKWVAKEGPGGYACCGGEPIPGRMVGAMLEYIRNGVSGGGFLSAVFENDLVNAYGRADGENLRAIGSYAGWLWNYAPAGCWGSKEKVAAWIEKGGLVGIEKAAGDNGDWKEEG